MGPELEEQTSFMHESFITSYKGLYCNICDGAKHKYFMTDVGSIIYTESFCREIIFVSIYPLHYYHVLLTNVINLATRFIMSCDHEATFKDRVVDPRFVFKSQQDHHELFDTCFEHINDLDWINYCKEICEQFSPSRFNREFFAPRIKQFEEYVLYVKPHMESYFEAEKKA